MGYFFSHILTLSQTILRGVQDYNEFSANARTAFTAKKIKRSFLFPYFAPLSNNLKNKPVSWSS
jgi:hypothetical protein